MESYLYRINWWAIYKEMDRCKALSGFLLNGRRRKHLLGISWKITKLNGIMNISLWWKDWKKVSLNFGVRNVIIHGALITVHWNFILPLKKIKMGFSKKMKFLLGLLLINLTAKIVMLMLIQVRSNSKVLNLVQNTLVENILIRQVFLSVTRFWNF